HQALAEVPVVSEVAAAPSPQNFAEVIALFESRREAIIAAHLKANVRLVAFEIGRIELRPTEAAPGNLTNQLSQLLMEWTGMRWLVARSEAEGALTVAEAEAQRASVLKSEVAAHPLVQAVLDAFPGATIAAVRERFADGVETEEAAAEMPGDGMLDDETVSEEDAS